MRFACFRISCVLLLLAATIGPALADRVPRPPPGPAPKLDLFGDPLPPGACARLGSIRLRHDASAVAFRDARTIISLGTTICFWDHSTGKLVGEQTPVQLQNCEHIALSADGRVLVTSHPNPRVAFHVWDLSSGS